jgi:hypothetical protein
MDTMGDLQEGIERAERLLGFEVKRIVASTDEAR